MTRTIARRACGKSTVKCLQDYCDLHLCHTGDAVLWCPYAALKLYTQTDDAARTGGYR